MDKMQGIWIRKCPRCGNYFSRNDPEESSMCCACGWQERDDVFQNTERE